MLKDKTLVVFHDKNLKRMTGINKNIENCTYDEIKDLKLKNTNQKIPLLKEVLELVKSEVLILIELKNTRLGLEKELVKLLDNYDNFLIETFTKRSIIWFNKNRPKYLKGLLTITNIKSSKMKGLDFFGIPLEIVYKIDKIKIPVFIWNINTLEEYRIARKYNATFIVDYEQIC